MKIIPTVKFGDEDTEDLRKLMGWVNQASAFFQEGEPEPKKPLIVRFGHRVVVQTVLHVKKDGKQAIERLTSGNILSVENLAEALREIVQAQKRLSDRKPDQFFTKELKALYEENLSEAGSLVQGWLDQVWDN